MYTFFVRKKIRIAITSALFLIMMSLCSNAKCQICNLICNTDFEDVQYSSSSDVAYPNNIPCWRTTDQTGSFEVWCNNFMGVSPHSGNQFIELNAFSVGSVYQDFVVNPGMNLTIKFAHRGRWGVDVMQVKIGPIGGPYTNLGNFSDSNTTWGFYSVPYSVPFGFGSNFRLEFISVSATGGNDRIGNFLDDISIEFVTTLSQTVKYPPILCYGSTTTATIIGSDGFLPYSFSIDSGPYSSTNSFTISGGTHSFNIKDNLGCIKSSVLFISQPSILTAPVVSVTRPPTCTIPTGTILVTSPSGAGIQYSIGGAYQSSGTFSNLTPNTYQVTTKDVNTGCISAVTNITVDPVPADPAAPTASVIVQPNCITPAGTIVITAPAGLNNQYSIGGAYQSSGTFSNLVPHTYQVTTKDVNTGCISAVTNLTVDPVPADPAAPTAFVKVQPTCTTPTGIIVVAAPTGINIEYSIGGTFQSNGTFSNLAPNSYSVTVKDVNTGCISSITNLTINTIPAAPFAPTVSLTVQPTCIVPTGTIEVTAPVGPNLQYSIGTFYQLSGIFSTLAPNSYVVTVKDILTGCISQATSLIVKPPLNNLLQPIANSAGRCGKGNLLLTASGSGLINWYDDSGLNNLIYSGTNFNSYLDATKKYYVITASGSCKSSATSVTGFVYPTPKPTLFTDSFLCPGEKIVLYPGVYNSYLWQDNSDLPTFTVSAVGTYTVIVTLDPGGCKDSASVKISYLSNCNDIYFPNAFSPNADLINSKFGPIGKLSDITNFSLTIYNRLGEIVFRSNNPYEKWDGRYRGQPMNTGNFVWFANYVFKGAVNTKKGNLLLIK